MKTIIIILLVLIAVIIIYHCVSHKKTVKVFVMPKKNELFTLDDDGEKYCRDALFRANQCCDGCRGDFCKEDCLGVYNTDIVIPPINCPFVFPNKCAMINE